MLRRLQAKPEKKEDWKEWDDNMTEDEKKEWAQKKKDAQKDFKKDVEEKKEVEKKDFKERQTKGKEMRKVARKEFRENQEKCFKRLFKVTVGMMCMTCDANFAEFIKQDVENPKKWSLVMKRKTCKNLM